MCACIENASDRTEACYIPVVAAAAVVTVDQSAELQHRGARAGCQWPECFDLSALYTHALAHDSRRRRLRPCTSTLGATCPLRARFCACVCVASQPVPPYTQTRTDDGRERARRLGQAVVVTAAATTTTTVPETGWRRWWFEAPLLPRNIIII